MIDNLPRESVTKTWLRDHVPVVVDPTKPKQEPSFGPWTTTDDLLASVCDRLDWLGQVIVQTTPGGKPPKVKPIPRPKPKVREDDSAWRAQLDAERAAHNERRRAAGLEV